MEAPDLRTDGELLVATASEPEAFGTFYRRHVRGVLTFFRRRAGSAEVAFELTADTFATALEASSRTSAGEEIVSLPGARPGRPAAA